MPPIRIAQMMTDMNYGGVEMVIMNYYRHIDKKRYQFDFYALEGSSVPQREEIEAMGGRVFVVPRYTQLPNYEKALMRHFKEEQYQIVHSNMNTLSVLSLYAAKKAGIPNRIVHNHSTAGKGEMKKNIMKYMLRPFAKVYPTKLVACSKYAGEWIYGKNADFTVFNNAIEVERFAYNPEIRKSMRKELGFDGKFVVGNVGRFCYQKNHDKLIDIFVEIKKRKSNAVLLLVGEGELESEVKDKVKHLGLDKDVFFLGKRNDTNRIYQAMDVFVLPSRYEGLPVVGVEAQAAGLPCIFSDIVTEETKILPSSMFIPVEATDKSWADTTIKTVNKYKRKDVSLEIRKAGFDIEEQAGKMMEMYDAMSKVGGTP